MVRVYSASTRSHLDGQRVLDLIFSGERHSAMIGTNYHVSRSAGGVSIKAKFLAARCNSGFREAPDELAGVGSGFCFART